MRTTSLLPALLLGTALLTPLAGHAADAPAAPPAGSEQVIEPRVARQDIKMPRLPSRDFEVGLFAGTYTVQNFGAHTAAGAHLTYHITEDFFVEGNFGTSEVTDEQYRLILPGGLFAGGKSKLTYYNMSAGVNVLPGEVFVGKDRAFLTSTYLIAGTGNTKFANQQQQTFNFGVGMRVLISNWFAVRFDMRDYLFPLDLLGARQNTHNLEFTTGVSFVF